MTPEAPSRRRMLAGGAALVATTAVAQTVGTGSAQAAAYPVNPYRRTAAPNWYQRHFLNRLGCGYSPAQYAQLRGNGGAMPWFERQLTPSVIPESATAKALPTWFPDMTESASAKWARNSAGTKGGWEYAADLAGYSMLRQIYSHRQVHENLVGFWSNHLHVHADTDLGWVHRASYDQTIRTHALGRFEDLLVAASLHPAMLLYLDNWRSVRNAPNENQGRELLELHTVGRSAGYTEAMVKDSAKILSGYTVDAFRTWDGFYDTGKHTTGPVQVLGFSSPNASSDGKQVTVDYLRYLANHPATALNIARKLCRHFVADDPSTAVVTAVAKAFRDSGTDIRATMRALVSHPDFAASPGLLVRNPVEDFVATCRVLGVAARKPVNGDSFARSCIWVPNTTLLYQWPRPDGLPLGDAPWASATRMLNSFRMHWNLAAGWWPTKEVTYRTPASWLPAASIRFDQYVDHLCRLLLGKGSDPRLLAAAVTATNTPPATVVTASHAVGSWLFVRLAGALLDSPDHMRR
jgi:uncharacterized protein (DUF1800 family)